MYEYIKGKMTDQSDSYIVVENNGIGYLINCPASISVQLGLPGADVMVFLYQSVREDDISLFGFSSKAQKEMFTELLSVSGVGPKVAHTICASLNPEQFAMAVLSDNVAMLSSVKGLGKKTAEKIIVEVRDKVKKKAKESGNNAVLDTLGGSPSAPSVSNDAISALVVLGYKEADAQSAVASCYEDGLPVEELIKRSLKTIAGKKFG